MRACSLVALSAVLSALPLRADSWAPPSPKVFGSEYGSHGFKVLKPVFGKPCEGVLFRLGPDGKDRVVWEAKLVNTPSRVLVDDGGKFVVTIDTYGNLGFAHSLVIYGDKGKVVRDFKLEDLLTKDEIATKVTRTISSRHWAHKSSFKLRGGHLEIQLGWGKKLRVELATGKIVTAE